jgi:ribonuclease HII
MLLNYLKKGTFEAGCDEAGRGCLAGPVFAAAVILPDDFLSESLNDSKKLTEIERDELRPVIEKESIAWGVAMYESAEIDKVNILHASIYAMHRALDKLAVRPQHLIIDGNFFIPYQNVPYKTIIKGDGKYLSIAAASILAKTYRDDYMKHLHEESPQYGWQQNKGYATLFHRKAIEKYGITPYHRKSFRLIDSQLSIEFGE